MNTLLIFLFSFLVYLRNSFTLALQISPCLCRFGYISPKLSTTVAGFVECLNHTSLLHNEEMNSRMKDSGGPSISIGIATYATSNIWDYASLSLAINELYAVRNGYFFHFFHHQDKDNVDERWNKISILESGLNPEIGWGKHMDYLVWIDADAVFVDHRLRIEHLLDYAHIVISAEHEGSSTRVNTGTIIVRNSRFARKLLQKWWNFDNRALFSDQEQFDMLYTSLSSSEKSKIAILPPNAINTDPPAMEKHLLTNPILHLMGEHAYLRTAVFNDIWNHMCSHPQNLQSSFLTAHYLQGTSIEVYGRLYEESLESVLLKANTGCLTLEESRTFSNIVHHLAHALLLTSQQSELASISSAEINLTINPQELRQQTYSILLRNILIRSIRLEKLRSSVKNLVMDRPSRPHPITTSRWDPLYHLYLSVSSALDLASIEALWNNTVFQQNHVNDSCTSSFHEEYMNWPEHIKIVAESGQHLFAIGSIDQRLLVMNESLALLGEIYDICHPSQQLAVLQMIATVYLERGALMIQEYSNSRQCFHDNTCSNNLKLLASSAEQDFQTAVAMLMKVSETMGEHILIQVWASLGNFYSIIGEYARAIGYFEAAIGTSQLYLGSDHHSLILLYLNLSQALIDSQIDVVRGGKIASTCIILLQQWRDLFAPATWQNYVNRARRNQHFDDQFRSTK